MTENAPEALNALYADMHRVISEKISGSACDGDFEQPVFGDGDAQARLLLLGEAPGAEEAAAGRPFVGKAGRQLDELLSDAGVLREQIFITNTVKYRPVVRSVRSVRNRTPSKHEVAEALPFLEREFAILRPAWIATLGNTPLGAILTLAGEQRDTIGNCHGTCRLVQIGGHACRLFPLYHPASGIYNRSLIDVMHQDARILGENLVKQG